MARKEYSVPGTTKKLIVDDSGGQTKITDENGKAADNVDMKKLNFHLPHFGKNADFIEVPEGTTFVTQHNPTCRWYFSGGKWYCVCG